MASETKIPIWMLLAVLALFVGAGLLPLGLQAEEPEASAQEVAEAEEPQIPVQLEDPREVLEQYPPFTVSLRIPVLEDEGLYPCSDCHDGDFVVTNPTVRELVEMHDTDEIQLQHGGGRFWCLTCHHSDDRDSLASLKGQPISFNESFLLCGQCHFERQQDFFKGAHGKRLGNWQGERLMEVCTGCHDPHDPAIKPRKPFAPPALRAGLSPAPESHHAETMPWEKQDSAGEHDQEESAQGKPIEGTDEH